MLQETSNTIDILFIHKEGRFSGEAFVLLPNSAAVDQARTKHKSYLGPRYIDVFPATKMVREQTHHARLASQLQGSLTGSVHCIVHS